MAPPPDPLPLKSPWKSPGGVSTMHWLLTVMLSTSGRLLGCCCYAVTRHPCRRFSICAVSAVKYFEWHRCLSSCSKQEPSPHVCQILFYIFCLYLLYPTLTHFMQAMSTSWNFLSHTKYVSASGPLHLLFPLSQCPCIRYPSDLSLAAICSEATFSIKYFLTAQGK